MSSRETAMRVLVLDASVRQALAACRALGGAGHEVGTAGWTDTALAGRSRHSARYHRLPSPGGPAAPFADALADAVEAHRYEAIVAVDDRTLARLDTVEVPVPSVPTLGAPFRLLTEKQALAELARRAGVDYPATCTVDEFLSEGGTRFPFPVVVKSARSGVATLEYAELASGARVVDEVRPNPSWLHRTATVPKPMRMRLRTAWTATCGSLAQAWIAMSPPHRAASRSSPMNAGRSSNPSGRRPASPKRPSKSEGPKPMVMVRPEGSRS